ncbi:ABC transporter substrate-binding protein [Neorhizobium galegae]|jgi:peptide/nickel transport system substrate-binding protein|uniref:ABC transporter substrate-binding protein n=1 Tax=Neorhizobium galegae TaxID=399 RepID=UPI0006229DAF|nr:ABC transporter substrate-binding protein [Neorhizobium galegae]MCQ1781217.1 ABC transporter substrate-binding protein [Neorhizobium galegae]MCQ1798525.1 ABC transporter substrate-binding protein [Neorhizobium galegae]CDZ30422.1 ABC-transport protein, solute-binding component [Neorhizobium galegae bv. officinalis]
MKRIASHIRSVALAALATAAFGAAAHSADLRIALADDPDALDSMTNRAQTGITVLTAMCDRLMWTDSKLTLTPGLAKSWNWSADGLTLTMDLVEGAKFQDGTPFDAEAVKINIERYLGKGSQRADDISTIASVEAPSANKVIIKTKVPSAQLLSKLAERPGIIFSPAAIKSLGENLGRAPVCIGPYKFVERVAQDRIVLAKDTAYYDAAKYSFDKVIFRIIPDDAVRLANLQSGELDLMEKLDPSNAASLASDKKLQILPITVLNNQTLVLNFNFNGPMQNPKIREALEYSIDRQAIVDVAFAGQYQAGNQFAAPDSPFYNSKFPVPARDPAKAKALIAEAGIKGPVPFTILVPNRPLSVRVGEMIQAMGSDAGFAIKLDVVDFATTLKMTDEGKFESWGPIGPQFANDLDTVAFAVLHSTGGRNLTRYKSPEMDKLLEASRTATDPAKRMEIFKEAAALAVKDRPVLYLYHQKPLFVAKAGLKGFHTTGDGFPKLDGLTLN